MRLGMVGLGRMGANMAQRLLRGGHEVVAYDVDQAAVAGVTEHGATAASSLDDLAAQLPAPRVVWLMVPAAVTAATVEQVVARLDQGDVLVDGGNTPYTDTVARAAALATEGVALVDAGTSGGIWGLEEGYCLMVGAEPEVFARLEPIFATLAPADGYARVGGPGAGHYTKMVHNGVEYALMQAYGEGFELLAAGEFDVDLAQVAELWRHGSVIRSWLLDLAADALRKDPTLEQLTGWVEDSGEGRWAVQAAVDGAVPVPTIALALFNRFASRHPDAFGNRLIAALRHEFGGHRPHEQGPP